MPGDGTRTAITTDKPTARCLDLTRLISRVGRGPDTGVDRVERAYLHHLIAEPEPLFVLVRTALGYVLLDRKGIDGLVGRMSGEVAWGRTDLLGFLSRRATPARRRAQADLRRLAVARCRTGRLSGMLQQHLPVGCAYINVGHSNLRDEVFAAWRDLLGARIVVLIHDTIPLDFPQYQRLGTPEIFEAKLRRVSAGADLVICNSQATCEDVNRWFGQFGRRPSTLVAHLGVVMPRPDPAELPADLDLSFPYFVVVGTIEPRKNHALLLDVWEALAAELPQEQVPRLIIAGHRGWANEAVFARLDTSSLREQLIFERPGLSDAALSALIAGSQGLLCPSHAEGFGLPSAEAVLLEVPVICNRLAVYEEFLGDIPVYLESDDVYLWKQSICRIIEDNKAGHHQGGGKSSLTKASGWTDHFNLVLKVT